MDLFYEDVLRREFMEFIVFLKELKSTSMNTWKSCDLIILNEMNTWNFWKWSQEKFSMFAQSKQKIKVD